MELIIIRGRQNDGKTTTATMLHNELVARSTAVRLLKINGDYLPVGNEVLDFRSVIDIKEKRVAIISAGDSCDVLNEEMEELIYKYRPDIMVVCARAQDREGSAYRMLKENYTDFIKEENEFWTEWAENPDDTITIKQSVVEKIVNRITNI
jgi:thymidylate kinase